MATKPGGAPYPLPTDPVAQGDDIMDALAAFADPSEMVLARTAAINVTTGAWGQVSGWDAPTYTKGTGLTAVATGVQVSKAGRYRCEAFGTYATSTAGARRGITCIQPGIPATILPPTQGGQDSNVYISQTITVAAAGIVSMYLFHDAGVTLAVSNIRLSVKREP